jgi:serine/threonine protein kinase
MAAAAAAAGIPIRRLVSNYSTLLTTSKEEVDSKITSFDFTSTNVLNKYPGSNKYVLPTGQTLGDYIKVGDFSNAKELGVGMSGKTYKLSFGDAGKPLVLKHIRNTKDVPKSAILREIDFLAAVKGQWFAVQLLAAQINEDGTAFMLFPFIPGNELFDVISKELYTPPQIRRILQYVLDGIKELHALGIIHRDIKPENIWVPDDGSIPPFLLDFGLSGTVDETLKTAGTKTYIRPERLGIIRKPTPDDNFYALARIASYVPGASDLPIFWQLVNLKKNSDIDGRFVGGKSTRKSSQKSARKQKKSRKNRK